MTPTRKSTAKRPSSPGPRVRRARLSDVPGIYACRACAHATDSDSVLCDERLLRMQIETFPDGRLVAILDKEVVGHAISLIIGMDDESPWYSAAVTRPA